MTRYHLAIILALYTCIGWGLASPLIVKMNQYMGRENYHPLVPYIYNSIGNILIVVVFALISDFSFSKSWTWHWSGWAILLFWPTAGFALVYGLKLVEGIQGGRALR